MGFSHRGKWVLGSFCLAHWNLIHKLIPSDRGSLVRRECGGDDNRLGSRSIHDTVQLRANIALESRIDFLVYYWNPGFHKCIRCVLGSIIGFGSGQSPALGVEDYDVNSIRYVLEFSDMCKNDCPESLFRELDSRIISTSEIIGDHSQFSQQYTDPLRTSCFTFGLV